MCIAPRRGTGARLWTGSCCCGCTSFRDGSICRTLQAKLRSTIRARLRAPPGTHGRFTTVGPHQVGEFLGRELTALIRIDDLGYATVRKNLLEHLLDLNGFQCATCVLTKPLGSQPLRLIAILLSTALGRWIFKFTDLFRTVSKSAQIVISKPK